MIALLSQKPLPSSSSSTGVLALGLIAMNSADFCAPVRRSTGTRGRFRPRRALTTITLREFGEGGKTCSFMIATPLINCIVN